MKVLIVDDSIVYRSAINQALSEVPGIDVFKAVSNGKIAVDFLKQNPDIDLITLDMEMPVMDGMETIKEIRKFNTKVTIICFSAFTARGAEKTIDALALGADDFVQKIEGNGRIEDSIEMIKDELLPKIEGFGTRTHDRPAIKIEQPSDVKVDEVDDVEKLVSDMPMKPKLIVLGCSTGGPEALTSIFKGITEKLSIPMLIVQHMPPMFTEKLAMMLDKISPNTVMEAKHGDVAKPGHVYIAPGDYHMVLNSDMTLSLNQGEKVCFVRPAVDVLFNSVAENFNGQILSIILTGMGEDGAVGCANLAKKSAYQFIQDKESCIVWGMPGAVSRANLGAKTLTLSQFPTLINTVSKRI